jgi:hypothetical protein
MMSATSIAILAFVAVLLAIGAAIAIVRDVRQSDSTRIRRRISETVSSSDTRSVLFKNLNTAAARTAPTIPTR